MLRKGDEKIKRLKEIGNNIRNSWQQNFPNNEISSEKKERFSEIWTRFWTLFKMIVVAIAIAFIIRGFLLIPVPVTGSSMEDTLSQGDMVAMERITSIRRFDIIVFQEPDGRIYIKRVIGLPGENISYQDDQLAIDGEAMEEDFLSKNLRGDTASNAPYTTNFNLEELLGVTQLDENQYFVLGDNRRASKDSRSFGAVDGDNILGKVRLIYYPLEHFELVQ